MIARFVAIAAVSLISLNVQAFSVPAFTDSVVDEARLLPVSTKRELSQALNEFRKKGGAQIAVLTVNDLGGSTIEQASIQVTDQWKMGSAQKDDGVLLLISKEDRAIRIEVGQGLEGNLTDFHSKQIIEDVMIPFFRSGQIPQGIVQGVVEIAEKTNPDLHFVNFLGQSYQPQQWRERSYSKYEIYFFIAVFLFFLIFGKPFRRRGMGFWGPFGAGYGLGRGGFGGFGGGGFGGGGGGGFSGGGASGRW